MGSTAKSLANFPAGAILTELFFVGSVKTFALIMCSSGSLSPDNALNHLVFLTLQGLCP
jgi:hypothetical protein